ncbi:MAG: acyltransferase [Planctomycetota bacterium]|nr:MAG: acyltransferase [Planctomycetota bacterium]
MSIKNELSIATVQFNADQENKEINLTKMKTFIESASKQGCDVISFPEICITGYNFILYTEEKDDLLKIAEVVPEGNSTKEIQKLSKEFNIVILFGLLEKTAENELFNTFVCVTPDGYLQKYRKIHAFENSFMSQGSEFPIFDLFGWKCGILICFDNNLPENTRAYALNGCDLLFAPHQTGGFDVEVAGMGRIDTKLWENKSSCEKELSKEFSGPKGREWILKWLPSRAYDNGMFHVFSNGVGLDYDELRTGNAMIIDPNGIVLSESASIDSDMAIAKINKDSLNGTLGRMHMKTRNPELYADLVKEFDGKMDSRSARNELTKNSNIV